MTKIPSYYSRIIKKDYVNKKNDEVHIPDVIYDESYYKLKNQEKKENKVKIKQEEKKEDRVKMEDTKQNKYEEKEDIFENIEDSDEDITKKALEEINKERQRLLDKAKVEIEKIRSQVEKNSYEEGFKKGYLEGQEKGYKESVEIKIKAIELFEEAEQEVKRYIAKEEKNIIQLAVDIAESIINTEIDQSEEKILPLVKPIISNYERNKNVVITCGEDNYKVIKDNLQSKDENLKGLKITVLKDKSFKKNQCVIENEYQIVDLDIKRQLKSIINEIEHME